MRRRGMGSGWLHHWPYRQVQFLHQSRGMAWVEQAGRKYSKGRRMKLTIGLATRRRPGILVRTVERTLEKIKNDNTRLVILVDDDDDGTKSVMSRFPDPR